MSSNSNENSCLSDEQLAKLSGLLHNKREELIMAISELNEQLTQKQDCSITDAVEAAALREQADRASGIATQHQNTIDEIDRALGRIKQGIYGLSEISGQAISYERLLLIPWARTAVDESSPLKNRSGH